MILTISKKIITKHFIRLLSTAKQHEVKFNKKFKMNAWQIHSYGDLSELQYNLARVPLIMNPDEVLIKVEAASINPIDRIMIGGYGKNVLNMFRGYELEFPLTLGRDFAGEIVDKGHHVGEELKIGDKVYGIIPLHKPGSHAEVVVTNKTMLCKKPNNLSAVEAASIPYAAMTAWSALYITGELALRSVSQSTKILILGASGGVGTIATQILRSQKADVSGTCSADAMPLIHSLGATNVFDYKSENFIKDVASKGIFDIILDCAKCGYENVPKEWQYKKYITLNSPLLINTDKYGLLSGLVASATDLVKSNVIGCGDGKSVRWGFFVPSEGGLKFIDYLVKTNQIKPVIHKVFKFNETPQAFEFLSQGHLRGKIVIDLQDNV